MLDSIISTNQSHLLSLSLCVSLTHTFSLCYAMIAREHNSATAVTPVTPAPAMASFIVSTKARCGVSELDARGNCREDCTNGCPAGQWCWGVHANYCDSKPAPNCVNPVQDPDRFRCGTSELEARELCGAPCPSGWPTNCAEGENCFSVNTNYCASCGYNPNAGRKMIRG
jgi:hypothetical protein